MASFDMWHKTLVTASGLVPGITLGNLGVEYGGIQMITPGTSTTVTVYDNTTATGDPAIPTTATLSTAGTFVSAFGSSITSVPTPGSGVRFVNGIYVNIGGSGSPKFWVYWR